MSKKYKVKHYHRKSGLYKAGPHPVSIVLTIVGLGLLVFVGISIYDPVYNFIMGNYETGPITYESESQAEQEGQNGEGGDQENPDPDPVPVAAGDLKTVFLPAATLASDTALDAFLNALEGTGVDSVMIDIKDKSGQVQFSSLNENARSWGTLRENPLDLRSLSTRLEARNLSLVVRLPAFRDEMAARGERGYAIRFQGGDWLWHDGDPNAGGKPWLNPYSSGARQYITDLAVEAVNAGARLVVLEDVQFPDGSATGNATFDESSGISRQQALSTFVEEITAAVEEAGGSLGIYLPVITTTHTAANEVRYGGNPVSILGNTVVLGLLPYQFSGTYAAEGLEVDQPHQLPANLVKTGMDYLRSLTATNPDLRVIPLMQGGVESAWSIPMDTVMVAEQIRVAEEAGASGYILFQNEGDYNLQ